jgi:NAD(P) transhydrogenase subunit alpha
MDSTSITTTISDLAAQQQKMSDLIGALAAEAHALAIPGGMPSGGHGFFMTGLTIFVLACFVGYYVVWRVTPALHSPLMAVTNAVSSVIIVGALLAAGEQTFNISKWFGVAAVALASVNIFGGFIVTQRMLHMYKKKGR